MDQNEANIVIIGDGYVGKSSILNAIRKRKFEEQIPNIYDDFPCEDKFNGKNYRLKYIDTAGQEEFAMIRTLLYKDANIFLLCFAVDDIVSYENIKSKWIPDLQEYTDVPIILIGTKSDLRQPNSKCISKEEIVRFQKKIGAVFYVECSSKKLEGIDDLKKKILKCLSKDERSCVVQ